MRLQLRLLALAVLALLTAAPSWAATPLSSNCEETYQGLIWGYDKKTGTWGWLHNFQVKCMGDVANYQDGAGAWQAVDLRWQETVITVGDGTYRLPYGRFGYSADLTNGWVRIHPRINGVIDWDAWMQISSQSPIPLDVEQHNGKLLEIHKETATICYCFYITTKGFNFEIELKEGYNTNNNDWAFNVTFQGLTRVGRKIYYDADGRFLGRMDAPRYYDAADTNVTEGTNTVTETINGATVTWSVAKAVLDSLTYPVKLKR